MTHQEQPPFEAVPRALTLSWRGKVTPSERLAQPFFEEVSESLVGSGFEWITETEEGFRFPDGVAPLSRSSSEPPTAFIDGITLLVGVSIFVGTSAGGWAVGEVCDKVLKKTIVPAFDRMLKKRDADPSLKGSTITVRFGAWYDTSQVYVEVIADVEPGADLDAIKELLPEAQRGGLAWIEEHGVTKPVLTYRVRHGELSRFPTLSRSSPIGTGPLASAEPTRTRPAFDPGYGIARGEEGMLPWEWAEERLAASRNYWIVTAAADGEPSAAPVWGVWADGAVYFGTNPRSRKGRNIERDPRIVIHLESGDEVVILHGEAEVSDVGDLILDAYEAKYGYRPPGTRLFRLAPSRALAWIEADYPKTATRFDF